MQNQVNVKKDKMKKPHKIIRKDDKEPEINPEYVEKIRQIEKDNKKPIRIKNIDELFIDE